jgi:hypothetical protein
LSFSEFIAVFAPSIGEQKLAGVEPVDGRCSGEDWEELTRKIRVRRAAPVPERKAIRHGIEAEDFLHPAVAVRRDDQGVPRQLTPRSGHTHDHVVVKLPLVPVIDELISPPPVANPVE